MPAESHLRVAHVQRQALLVKLLRPRREQALFRRRRRRQVERRAAVVQQLERDLRVRQGEPQQHLGDVPELGGGALDELPPGGGVEEEVADFDGRADVPRRRLRVGDRAAAVEDLVRRVGVRACGRGSGRGRRSRCSPAPRRGSPWCAMRNRSSSSGELAGGVGGKRQRQVVRRDAAAVVDDADQRPPAVFDFDGDLRRARRRWRFRPAPSPPPPGRSITSPAAMRFTSEGESCWIRRRSIGRIIETRGRALSDPAGQDSLSTSAV